MYFVVVHKKKIVKLVHYVEPYLFCFPSARGFPFTEVQCSFERSSIPFFTTLYIYMILDTILQKKIFHYFISHSNPFS